MPMNWPRGGGGGMGRLAGQFTRTGLLIAVYYSVAYVLGLIITNWVRAPWIMEMLLQPLNSGRFALWQVLTHILVYYPSMVLGFLINMLMFWLFAWQVEYQLGRQRFLFLIFGVPLLSGVLGLPFTLFGPFQAPLAGFSLILDVLIVAFAMMNRNAVINFLFILPMRASQLIWVLIGFHALTFIALENPWFIYNLISIGLTFASFKVGFHVDLELWKLRWKERKLRRQQSRFSVIHGGRDDDEEGPMYH